MKKFIAYNEQADRGLDILSRGAFLTSAHNGKTNVMTIAWGSFSFAWKKPVFMAMVRPSRFSHDLIEASGEFTVSIPFSDMKQAIAICGSRSGRDTDKIAAADLKMLPSEKINTPVINTPGLHYECKIICRQQMTPEDTAELVKSECYASGDFHTLYFGEIVSSYVIE
ncbi:flavin reductase [Anaerosporomusa subterranea]|uniref:Flavin reductase n=1 Tax=Anaerosporomusa subterranea TaxID=1794912 RepID=A0A154BQL4_ANASB|nr:flavin reductase family protein [Anaerosporomusa subterranea]KYZ76211.1 flavin reductase [Anaerosporomusa subterranea]